MFYRRKRRWLFWTAASLPVVFALIVAGYFYSVYKDIGRRFESRIWSIPSRVFSAAVPLYPGLPVSASELKQMLEQRRYLETQREPLRAGEYRVARGSIIAYLREFQFPGHTLPAQRVQFDFSQSGIASIQGPHGNLPFLELEPMEVARLFGRDRESRLLVSIRQVNQDLIDAVLAIEDHRFYEHGAIDWRGISRALWADLRAGRVVQGGSTITQQLVKNYFLQPERNLKRKIQEASMALILESLYTKDQLLEIYLNEIYLGQRGSVAVHGIGEAARFYFGRNVEDLTLAESATLAGMICGPNSYSPFTRPDAAKERRDTVLKRMLEIGKITREEYEKAVNEPLRVPTTFVPVNSSPYFVDYVKQQLQELYAQDVLASEGLNIYTSLHPEMAFAGEAAVREGLEELEREYPRLRSQDQPLQAALIAVQPKTGAVMALVGGRDYGESSFNRALHAYRQPGSAIKPFIYLSALDQYSAVSRLPDEPISYSVDGSSWSPRNYDNRFRGRVSFRQALEESLNVPTVNLAMSVGLDKVIATLRTLNIHSPLQPMPSLALGAFEVTPLELAEAYTVLDNDGQRSYLLGLREIVTENGEVQQRRNVDMVSVTSPAKAYLITELLQGAMERGTGRSVKNAGIDFTCAGKTGTTNDYRDSWFAGYTSDLLVVVWVGFDDNRPTNLSGAQGAGRIWARFMRSVRPWLNPQPFRMPPGVVQRIVCVTSGRPANITCPEKRLEFFLADNAPKDYCNFHVRR